MTTVDNNGFSLTDSQHCDLMFLSNHTSLNQIKNTLHKEQPHNLLYLFHTGKDRFIFLLDVTVVKKHRLLIAVDAAS